MLMVLILFDGEEQIPITLPLKVLITCNMLTLKLLMVIGRFCGVREDLITSRLSCVWLHMSVFSQMFVGVSGELEYHPPVLVVGGMMRLLSMCCVIVFMQLKFGFV
jgi:hypothetical protein